MKILTFNTHSLVEKNYKEKLDYFVEKVIENNYDVIALQEVNQTHNGEAVKDYELITSGYISCSSDVEIKSDNHIYNAVKKLREKGYNYFWTWISIKLGYGIYDEGIGIITKKKPFSTEEFYISANRDFYKWKTRKAVGIGVEINGKRKWFYSVHMGWWNDEEDSFLFQWGELEKKIKKDVEVYLMGDFNNPAEMKNEGYDKILNSGWHDTYILAEKKDSGITVSGAIDGWRDCKDLKDMRIDFIFKNNKEKILSSKVIFNGINGKIISDHFGVEIIEQ